MAIEQQRKLIRFKDERFVCYLKCMQSSYKTLKKNYRTYIQKQSLGSSEDAWDWDEIRRGKDLEAILRQMEMSIDRMNGEVTGVITNSIKTVGVVDYAFASTIAAAHIQGYIIVPPVIPERAIKVLLEEGLGSRSLLG